ncbi:MAG: holo-ACP synthase [Candidatus Poribacteria bacterium]|jgi:holo-[acyl-carrier protein] synthase
MIVGIGIDLVEVPRIAKALSRWGDRFESRIFTEKEMNYCNSKKDRSQRLACRFAAKEALLKALGTGWRYGINWKEIEVMNDELGKPSILLSGRTEEFSQQIGVKNIFLSITSTENYGAAQVILVSN